MEAPYKIVLSKSSSYNTFEISGSLVINHIENIYKELKDKVDFSKKHIFQIEEIESVDLTFVQLLLALKNEFQSFGTDFEVKFNISDEQQLLFSNSGFVNQFHN
jgi:hypothetical protein